MPDSPLTLWYQQPARDAINEGLPIGNGRLGGLLLGGETERFQFNENSLWTGGENPSGDYESMGSYQKFGDLFLGFDEGEKPQVSVPSGQIAFSPNEEVAASIDGRSDSKWCVEMNAQPVIWQTTMSRNAARLLELAQSARQEDAPAPGVAPYKGLLFFDESDAEWFLGTKKL